MERFRFIERFAKFDENGEWVRYAAALAAIEQARREEREACAQICDDLSTTGKDSWSITRSKAFFDAGRAIRARGEAGVYTQGELDAADKRAEDLAARLKVE